MFGTRADPRRRSLMPRNILKILVVIGSLAIWPIDLVMAQDAASKCEDAGSTEVKPATRADDNPTNHALALEGRCLKFQATAGSIRLVDEKDAPQADVAFVAYRLEGQDAAARPVTFAIHGGPRAGSAGLPLGAAGPPPPPAN